MRKISHSVKFYFVVQNLKIGQTLINSVKYVFFEKYEFFSQKLKTKGGAAKRKIKFARPNKNLLGFSGSDVEISTSFL